MADFVKLVFRDAGGRREAKSLWRRWWMKGIGR